MSEHVYLITILIVPMIFAMRYVSVVMSARARFANDESYRQLAERAAASQAASATALASIDAALADLRVRMAGVEKVLKEVE